MNLISKEISFAKLKFMNIPPPPQLRTANLDFNTFSESFQVIVY